MNDYNDIKLLISDIDGNASTGNITVEVAADTGSGTASNKLQGAESMVISSDWGNVKVSCVSRGEGPPADRMWVIISAWGTGS